MTIFGKTECFQIMLECKKKKSNLNNTAVIILLAYGTKSVDDWCLRFQDSIVVSHSSVRMPNIHFDL